MTYSDIKGHLQQGTVPEFLIFSGDEIEVQRAYINRIASAKGQTVRRVDTVAEITKTKGVGLFGKTLCYVCRDDADFQRNESAWDKVQALLKGNTLIYTATKIDKRSKFYTRFEKQIVVFDYMQEPVLIKHIKEHIGLTTDNCKRMIHVCGGDYGRILSETDKVLQYMRATHTDEPNSAFEILLSDGTIYMPPDDVIFDWVAAVLAGKPKLSFELLQGCYDIGEPVLRLLLVLYQGVKRLLQVQSCESKDIMGTTGLTQWEINLVKDYVDIYSNMELVSALRHIQQLEMGIKMGTVDEEYAVPFAMVSLLYEG